MRPLACLLLSVWVGTLSAETIGKPGANELVLADGGKSAATVVVAENAGVWEKKAAADLALFLEKMSGAKVAAAASVPAGDSPALIVGQAAIAADPSLSTALVEAAKKAKPDPVLRSDAIVLKRAGNRVYLAGLNDDCHYYAVAEFLKRCGCRWYLPTEFGECIPEHATLKVGELNDVYAPFFEVRRYWLSWNGDTTGKDEFMRRNFFNDISVPSGHCLGKYTKDLIPPGKSMFNVPISEDRTAEHVAKQILPAFEKGETIMLGLEDGVYESDSAQDKELNALQYDKYFLTQSYTDAFMQLYNKTSAILLKHAPQSKSKIGFLIYSNITLPPVKDVTAAKPLVGYLAPIDFDPIHGMDDVRSGPRREYKDVMYKWAKVMERRLVIYDYDQSMLVWRDIPNPSHQAFRCDVKHYRQAGLMGVDVESRGAMATIFLNLYLRGELMWNPDVDVDAKLAEFYPKFYGPAAKPMEAYWSAIYQAWENTLATEHEYFVSPAIYTPELIATLRKHLAAAEEAVKPLAAKTPTPREKQVLDRLQFTKLGFEVIDSYAAMTQSAATDCDFAKAVAAGERGLAAREKLTELNGTFTTYKKIGEHGYAWWPGEVQQFRELAPFTSGDKGALVAKTPVEWNFRRDPDNVGAKAGWQKQAPDLAAWDKLPQPVSFADRQANAGQWERLRTDLYAQAQSVVTADYQSFTGQMWYQTDLTLDASQAQGPLHLKFPGMFNEAWLFINGEEVAHREFKGVWWMNDYRFEWDVDVAGKLKAGANSVVVRLNNPHHFGGIFRRPFVYRAK